MLRRVSSAALAPSTERARPIGQPTDQLVGGTLADIARMLWPHKTAENIAAFSGCTVRTAERYLAADREWSGDALAAIVAEICRRHAMRNIKINSRV